MKRTNIRAGVVYVIKSSYGPPVLVEYEARAAHDRQRMKAADQMQIRRNTAIAALAGLGITAAPGDPGTVMLTLDEAEKVLRLAAKEADQ
jgi:hypothetical protein